MKNLVLLLFVTLSSVVFSQPDLDSLNKLPFNIVTNPTTFNDLSSFDLNKIYNLESFSNLLSERYGCFVSCDEFAGTQGFNDIVVILRPNDGDVYECSLYTMLSITENLFKKDILLENVNLYYEICRTTSEN